MSRRARQQGLQDRVQVGASHVQQRASQLVEGDAVQQAEVRLLQLGQLPGLLSAERRTCQRWGKGLGFRGLGLGVQAPLSLWLAKSLFSSAVIRRAELVASDR